MDVHLTHLHCRSITFGHASAYELEDSFQVQQPTLVIFMDYRSSILKMVP
jgi:hypothetical protein